MQELPLLRIALVFDTGWLILMSVSARALDGVYGRSAVGVRARIERASDGGWALVASGETDVDGRIADWGGTRFERGAHRLVLDSNYYFARLGVTAAYSEVAVVFRIRDESDTWQIQVVLAPSSYSMYFGTRG
jgi:5-hydroxyisourate hydrolase